MVRNALLYGTLKAPVQRRYISCVTRAPIAGKVHDKHVRRYFMQLPNCLPNQLPEKLIGPATKAARLEEPPRCAPCSQVFNSEQQLEQHLMGRNHKRLAPH